MSKAAQLRKEGERGSGIRNDQLNNACLNKCQMIEVKGILSGYNQLKACNQQNNFLSYISLSEEKLRIFCSQEFNYEINTNDD